MPQRGAEETLGRVGIETIEMRTGDGRDRGDVLEVDAAPGVFRASSRCAEREGIVRAEHAADADARIRGT